MVKPFTVCTQSKYTSASLLNGSMTKLLFWIIVYDVVVCLFVSFSGSFFSIRLYVVGWVVGWL